GPGQRRHRALEHHHPPELLGGGEGGGVAAAGHDVVVAGDDPEAVAVGLVVVEDGCVGAEPGEPLVRDPLREAVAVEQVDLVGGHRGSLRLGFARGEVEHILVAPTTSRAAGRGPYRVMAVPGWRENAFYIRLVVYQAPGQKERRR